ncbi:MAG: hypothetical protein HPY89_00035 [Pelotomaculum sp.]|nr:hypothetical protein [Pelotomaculum sp.]
MSTRTARLLLMFAACFLFIIAAAPAADAATQTNPLQSYWNRYYGGKVVKQRVTIPSRPATVPPPVNPVPPANAGQQDTSRLSVDEKLMFDLVNQERAKNGLAGLALDMRLVELARLKSQDMYQNSYFSHTSPTYGTAYDMERKAGITARVMGAENIAKAATTQRAHELFMNSTGHRANILNPQHDTIGIGIFKTQNGVVVTQLFTGN